MTSTIAPFQDAAGWERALYAFLAEKAKQFKLKRAKGTRELLVQNLDDGILREGAKAV